MSEIEQEPEAVEPEAEAVEEAPPAEEAQAAEHEPEEPQADEPQAEDQADEPEERGELGKVRREAAGYRRRLRDTEGERDRLAGQVEAMQRSEVERVAGRGLASGSDLWAAGVDLVGLRDDDGALDESRVAAAVDGVLATRPHWRRVEMPDLHGGARGGGLPSAPAGDAFADRLRKVAG